MTSDVWMALNIYLGSSPAQAVDKFLLLADSGRTERLRMPRNCHRPSAARSGHRRRST
jgi:hypothetical protein